MTADARLQRAELALYAAVRDLEAVTTHLNYAAHDEQLHQLPANEIPAITQRLRWLHGRLTTRLELGQWP